MKKIKSDHQKAVAAAEQDEVSDLVKSNAVEIMRNKTLVNF
jgi:hypothetical protein